MTWTSPNHDSREGQAVDMLVLHYTGMPTARGALKRLCDPAAEVSAHWLIEEDGTVHHLVYEDRRAWHAGVAHWRGNININARSVGIELVNPGHEFGYRPFPEAQMRALMPLCRKIIDRHPIPARNVVGHSDVAPRRKQDPGELFDWRRLAGEGIGVWPEPAGPGDRDTAGMLAEWGWETEDLRLTLEAFQRRYRPTRVDGVDDAETRALLAGLLRTPA